MPSSSTREKEDTFFSRAASSKETVVELKLVGEATAAARICHGTKRSGAAVASAQRRLLCLHRLDVFEQHLLVALRIYLLVDLAQDALRIDEEAGTVPVFGAPEIRLSDAGGAQEFGFGIREQIDRKREFVAELLV